MTPEWTRDAVIYHIYPLGLCNAPRRNDFQSEPSTALNALYDWIEHIQTLGANTIYIGPLFESSAHGYDTADYFQVDRRLGSNATLKNLIAEFKQRGMRIILDAVFNHVGRDFWVFRDILQNKQQSTYYDWFANINFDHNNPYNDGFSYEGWAGHYELIKLNHDNPAVRQHLFDAVTFWVEYFNIDGLRLDAADVISFDFLRALREHCTRLKNDFWLMGEVVHGDYRKWANTETLHTTTNYEVFKGLYSSHVDCNYFEIAYSLNRQFGTEGIYQELHLYNFVDNHDVNRLASNLTHSGHLYTAYGLLFTIPGIPSIYYGSEWGITGQRTPNNDQMLRPAIDLSRHNPPEPDLCHAIQKFAQMRQHSPALKYGRYRQLSIAHEQFAFERHTEEQTLIVLLNASAHNTSIHLHDLQGNRLIDLLNPGDIFHISDQHCSVEVPRFWLRILQVGHS